MPNFSAADMRIIDRVLEMESGWVLDFSNASIARFFLDDLNIDFDDARYAINGSSKAKRLRTFLQVVDKATALRALSALGEYRKSLYAISGRVDPVPNADGMLLDLIHRANGQKTTSPGSQFVPPPAIDVSARAALKSDLIALNGLEPQARGYAFEKFLNKLFRAYGLDPNGPFRQVGEQIDGSFKFEGEFYLLEAKWNYAKTPAADLHVFQGKIQGKAAWTRGLFVSNSGFTAEGISAFERSPKNIICMDGLDLWTMLDKEIPLTAVLDRKVRRASEYGDVFRAVHDLF